MTPWLHVVGIGEDGLNGLPPAVRAVVESAEVLVGGARHHARTEGVAAERVMWPSPWDALLGTLEGLRGRRVVVLVTGDPSWFSAGETIVAAYPGEVAVHPHPGAFSLAAGRMGWALQDAECLTVHGRPLRSVLPVLAPGARLLLLAEGPGSAAALCRLLVEAGWRESVVTALWHLGGEGEGRRMAPARDWQGETPALATLAVECVRQPGLRAIGRWGLPDDCFASDGTMTKREVRAATLAKLAPAPGAMLWDVGLGSGSVAIEWMRAGRGARAVGVEPRADRRALAAANALALGVPGLEIVAGEAPGALEGLPRPDAVFLGGGLSEGAFEAAWEALAPGGRVVANAVTLEGQGVLAGLFGRHGGELCRIAVSRAEPVGRLTGWRPAMEVMQWAAGKA